MALISIYLFLRLFISSAWGVAPRQAFHLGTISQSLFWLMTSVHGCSFAILEKYLTFFIKNVDNSTKCLDSYYPCENLGVNMESIACGVCLWTRCFHFTKPSIFTNCVSVKDKSPKLWQLHFSYSFDAHQTTVILVRKCCNKCLLTSNSIDKWSLSFPSLDTVVSKL